jgi:hypothetical protein
LIEQDISLRNYTPSKVNTTGVVEDVLSGALEKLLCNVSPNWLSEERKKPYRLDPNYLTKSLSLISGMRQEGVLRHIHRFAQALLCLR